MKKLIVGLIIGVKFGCLSGVAMAMVTSPPATVSAKVVSYITITNGLDLVFRGYIVHGEAKVVAPDDTTAAKLTIMGYDRALINVTVPATVIISGSTGSKTITLISGAGQAGNIIIPAGGTHIIRVGGLLSDSEHLMETGFYVGSFMVSYILLK